MRCPNCGQNTSRLIIDKHGEYCASCRGLSENGGAKLTGILTRNSDRIHAQQHTNEGDMILPHIFDKQLNKMVPNEEFMAKYPDQLPTFFTESELKRAGYSKPDKIYEKKAAKEAAHAKEREAIEFVPDVDGSKMAEVVENI